MPMSKLGSMKAAHRNSNSMNVPASSIRDVTQCDGAFADILLMHRFASAAPKGNLPRQPEGPHRISQGRHRHKAHLHRAPHPGPFQHSPEQQEPDIEYDEEKKLYEEDRNWTKGLEKREYRKPQNANHSHNPSSSGNPRLRLPVSGTERKEDRYHCKGLDPIREIVERAPGLPYCEKGDYGYRRGDGSRAASVQGKPHAFGNLSQSRQNDAPNRPS